MAKSAKSGSMFWPIVLFILAMLAFAGVAEENKQEDPCKPHGCHRVPPSEPDVDGTLPPGLDK